VRQAAFPSEPTRLRVRLAQGQGRLCRPARAGRLDRLHDPARDTDVSFGSSFSTGCASPMHALVGVFRLCFSPPLCRRERAEGGYRTCSTARRKSEDYCDAFDYSAKGTEGSRERPAPSIEHHAPYTLTRSFEKVHAIS
jgi:hypothetical protein